MNRRGLILNTFGAATLTSPIGAFASRAAAAAVSRTDVPHTPGGFLTLAEIESRTRVLETRYPRLIRRRPLGVSRHGHPIDLITVGAGRLSALLIAGVHANEPVGGSTIDALLRRLCADDALRSSLDTTWHIVNPIDPDGLLLNEGWLKRPLTPRSYLRDFYRPALARQPDYTFPLYAPGYAFTASPPENAAWRLALDLTRPDWQFSLHNAEFGGAFFLTSRNDGALQSALAALPASCGLPLSTVGEPPSGGPSRARGIFAMPRISDLLGGEKVSGAWTAGDTSTDYAERFGTLSFTAEVPYWSDPRAFDPAPAGSTLGDAVRADLAQVRSGFDILEDGAPLFEKTGGYADELIHALAEQVSLQRGQLKTSPTGLSETQLSKGNLLLNAIQLRLFSLRGHAMLSRLARINPTSPGAGAIQERSDAFIENQLLDMANSVAFVPLDPRSLISLQFSSALTVAALMAPKG